MSIIKELIPSSSGYAFFVILIGKSYQDNFFKVAYPNYKLYCEKNDIGFIAILDYIIKEDEFVHPYNINPGYQSLLAPAIIKDSFPNYTFLCDVDADCIPNPMGECIFKNSRLEQGTINIVSPTPVGFSRQQLGKRISLLRKLFLKSDFPLDSLMSASDEDEKKLLKFDFDGPIATIGTCLGYVDDLIDSGNFLYKSIKNNFVGYIQIYRNDFYQKNFSVNWLPYEFQAIWNFELAVHYPFLYMKQSESFTRLCIESVLSRVHMLHFAGSWSENNVFNEGPFTYKSSLKGYFHKLDVYQKEILEIKSYGKIRSK